ncbi:zf-HC2 domain-containing protein [Streptomyces uncialis]|uniref:anti-sigma factor family protein n=1 Tax=Streptomyces uncialis TaxID=1048205 RepID=UPI0037901486|nr:zf-HC2 domain-containing protein [Streptomyces uncialis]
MTGSRPTPVEQHLGDRLAALVDGELGHDSRDRVLAHLATCARCKAEADAQRRLKNVFAEAAPPPPSESFLARLQGLPGGGSGDPGGPGGPGGPRHERDAFGGGLFDMGADTFVLAPATRPAPALPATAPGFRIHAVGRPESERSAARGRRRFAFAAAGAVSLAAIALGGVNTGPATVDSGDARGPSSNNVTPLRTQGGGTPAGDAVRRRATAPMLGQRTGGALAAPVAPASAGAPLVAGTPAQPPPAAVHALAAPLLAGASVASPLLHPLPQFVPPGHGHARPPRVHPADDPAIGGSAPQGRLRHPERPSLVSSAATGVLGPLRAPQPALAGLPGLPSSALPTTGIPGGAAPGAGSPR